MRPREMAEALETARYNDLRGDTWLELGAGERATRSALCLRALEAAGILRRVAELEAEAARVPDLAATLARRDAQLSRLTREHAEALEHAGLQRATQVVALETQINEVRAELMEARDAHRSARAAVLRLEDQIAAALAEVDQARANHRDIEARMRLAQARAATAEARAAASASPVPVERVEADANHEASSDGRAGGDASPEGIPQPRSASRLWDRHARSGR